MFIYYNTGLKREIKQGLRNRQYSPEAVEELYYHLKADRNQKLKGFRSAAIIATVIFVILMVLTWIGMGSSDLAVKIFTLAGTGLILFLVFWIYHWNLCNLSRNQFVAAVKQGYPELADRFSKESFDEA